MHLCSAHEFTMRMKHNNLEATTGTIAIVTAALGALNEYLSCKALLWGSVTSCCSLIEFDEAEVDAVTVAGFCEVNALAIRYPAKRVATKMITNHMRCLSKNTVPAITEL